MPSPDDKLTDIPRIVAQRDDDVSFSRARPEAAEVRKHARGSQASGGDTASASGAIRFFAVAGFLIAALAAAAAGFLYLQNQALGGALEQATLRISDLEGRLSSTDDSVNQSSAQMQVKLKELAGEVDKLWGSAWKKNGARIDEALAAQKKGDAEASRQIAAQKASLEKLQTQLAAAQELSITLATLKDQQSSQQNVVTRLASTVTTLSNTQRAQEARLEEAEQWVQSNIEFRKQVMQRLTRLENPPSAMPKE